MKLNRSNRAISRSSNSFIGLKQTRFMIGLQYISMKHGNFITEQNADCLIAFMLPALLSVRCYPISTDATYPEIHNIPVNGR